MEEAKARLRLCYDIIEQEMSTKIWTMGEAFGMADCSASPALFYANKVLTFDDHNKNLTAYFDRLKARS